MPFPGESLGSGYSCAHCDQGLTALCPSKDRARTHTFTHLYLFLYFCICMYVKNRGTSNSSQRKHGSFSPIPFFICNCLPNSKKSLPLSIIYSRICSISVYRKDSFRMLNQNLCETCLLHRVEYLSLVFGIHNQNTVFQSQFPFFSIPVSGIPLFICNTVRFIYQYLYSILKSPLPQTHTFKLNFMYVCKVCDKLPEF